MLYLLIRFLHLSFSQEHFCTIALTDTQLHDIARREKLRRLRSREEHNNQNQILLAATSPILSTSILSPKEEQQSLHQDTSSAPDLLKDHIDGEHARRQKKV